MKYIGGPSDISHIGTFARMTHRTQHVGVLMAKIYYRVRTHHRISKGRDTESGDIHAQIPYSLSPMKWHI